MGGGRLGLGMEGGFGVSAAADGSIPLQSGQINQGRVDGDRKVKVRSGDGD